MFYWLAICGFYRNFRQFMDLHSKMAIYSGLTWHVVTGTHIVNIKPGRTT